MKLGRLRYASKYLAIQHFYREKHWSINWMCKQLEVTRAAYYKWLSREVPEAEKENETIAQLIREYDDRFNHILGYRRMTDWINRLNSTNYSQNRVHRIMKELNIHSVIRRKKRKYVNSTPETTAENILGGLLRNGAAATVSPSTFPFLDHRVDGNHIKAPVPQKVIVFRCDGGTVHIR